MRYLDIIIFIYSLVFVSVPQSDSHRDSRLLDKVYAFLASNTAGTRLAIFFSFYSCLLYSASSIHLSQAEKTVVIGLQFICNSCAGNDTNQGHVWSLMFPSVFRSLSLSPSSSFVRIFMLSGLYFG
jgi:hypothetical protein